MEVIKKINATAGDMISTLLWHLFMKVERLFRHRGKIALEIYPVGVYNARESNLVNSQELF